MEAWRIKEKISEMRSYIASDWPSLEERKNLYEEIYKLESILGNEEREAENKRKEDSVDK
jgi:hypothetical protein